MVTIKENSDLTIRKDHPAVRSEKLVPKNAEREINSPQLYTRALVATIACFNRLCKILPTIDYVLRECSMVLLDWIPYITEFESRIPTIPLVFLAMVVFGNWLHLIVLFEGIISEKTGRYDYWLSNLIFGYVLRFFAAVAKLTFVPFLLLSLFECGRKLVQPKIKAQTALLSRQIGKIVRWAVIRVLRLRTRDSRTEPNTRLDAENAMKQIETDLNSLDRDARKSISDVLEACIHDGDSESDADFIRSLARAIHPDGVNRHLPLAQGLLSPFVSCGLADSFTPLLSNLETIIDKSILKFGSVYLSCTLVIVGITCHNRKAQIFGAIGLLASTAMTVPSEQLEFVRNFVTRTLAPKAQGGTEVFTGAVSMIFMFLHCSTIGTLPRPQQITTLMTMLAVFPRSTAGLSEIVTWLREAFDVCLNFILVTCCGKARRTLFSPMTSELRAIVEQVEQFNSEFIDGKLTVDYVNATRISTIQSELRALISRSTSSKDSGVRSVAQSNLKLLDVLETPFRTAKMMGGGRRMRPLALFINGATGSGKTHLTIPLVEQIVMRTVDDATRDRIEENINDLIYSREVEQEYWDGYHNQFCTVFDDFGQAVDVAGKLDNEYMDIIRCCSNFPHSLHMSNLADKGRTFFTSKMIVATTNRHDFLGVRSIISTEALERRFDINVTVAPKLEFCKKGPRGSTTRSLRSFMKRRLDETKIPDNVGFDSGIYEFHLFRFPEKGEAPFNVYYAVLDYDELIAHIVDKYRSRMERFERYTHDIDVLRKATMDEIKAEIASKGKEESWSDIKANSYPFQEDKDKTFLSQFISTFSYERMTAHAGTFKGWFSGVPYFLNRAPKEAQAEMPECDDLELVPDDIVLSKDYKLAFSACVSKTRDYFESRKRGVEEALQGYPLLGMAYSAIAGTWKIWTLIALMYSGYKLASIGVDAAQPEAIPTVAELKKEQVAEEVTVANAESRDNLKKVVSSNASYVKRVTAIAEGGYDQNLDAILRKIMRLNHYSMTWNDTTVGFATFITDRLAIFPRHFIYIAERALKNGSDTELIMHSAVGNSIYRLPLVDITKEENLFFVGGSDLAVCRFSNKMRNHQDITKFFAASMDSISSARDYDVRLHIESPEESRTRSWNSKGRLINRVNIAMGLEAEYTAEYVIAYMAKTNVGHCGSLLSLEDVTVNTSKIIGFHIAGLDDGRAFATYITRTMLQKAVDHFGPVEFEFDEFGPPLVANAQGSFVEMGTALDPVSRPVDSKIIPGTLYGKFGPIETAPARLRAFRSDGGKIDPMDVGLSKYDGCPLCIPEAHIKLASEMLYADLVNSSRLTVEKEVYSFEDAVCGRAGEPYFDAIPRNTSAGYPWCHKIRGPYRGKTWWFGNKDQYDLTCPPVAELRARCQLVEDSAKRGKRELHVFTDYLKDERRTLAKVAAGKTRCIFAGPLDYLILVRRYFLSFGRWIMLNRIDNGIAVGINPYQEWSYLATHLLSHSQEFVAGDFSGFDGSQVPEILWAIYGIIDRWYSTEENHEEKSRVRRVLWEEVVNSVHISGSRVYMWTRSLPSGHPLTTIINSLYNHMNFRLAWFKSVDFDRVRMLDFSKHVRLVTYGDDGTASVLGAPHFNQNTIPGFMTYAGATWTHESKAVGEYADYRKITELDFLKRHFRYDHELGQWLAPLALSSVIEPVCWTKKGSFEYATQVSNVEGCVRELSLHTREVYEEWASKLFPLSEKYLEHVPLVRDYDYNRDLTLSSEYQY